MKHTRSLIALMFVLCVLALPTQKAKAKTSATDGATLSILTQPFNILNPVNAQFILSASPDAIADDNDRLEFQLHRRLSSREALKAVANGEAVPAVIDSVSLRLSRVPRNNDGLLIPVVPILQATNNQVSLLISQDGVYPLTIRVTDSESGKVITSVLTFLNRRTPAVQLPSVQATTFLSLTAPPSLSPKGVFEITDETRAKVRRTIEYLANRPRPATIYVQPEILAALGTSPLPADVELLTSLRDQLRRRSITTSTFVPTDVSMMANAGLEDEFIEQLRLGETTMTKYLPGVTIVRNTWVADSVVDRQGLDLLHKAGITGVILLNRAQEKAQFQAPRAVLARPDGSMQKFMSVISVDPEISTELAADAVPTHIAYRIAAELLMERDDLLASEVAPESIRLVLASTSSSIAAFDSLETIARAVAGNPGIKMTDMTIPQTVTDSTPSIAFPKLSPNVGNEVRNAISVIRRQLKAILSMFSEDDVRRDSLGYLIGIAASEAVASPTEYVNGLNSQLEAIKKSVSATTPREVTLSSRTGSVRLQVRNDSTSSLTVVVRLSSTKLELDKPLRLVNLPPKSTIEVVVPATTRTNGRFPIGISVSTPEGSLAVVPFRTITARVTAIAGLGQLVSITLLLVLLAWWWSHYRKSRLDAGTTPTAESTVSEQ